MRPHKKRINKTIKESSKLDFTTRKHRTSPASCWEITYDENFTYAKEPLRNLSSLYFNSIIEMKETHFNKLILDFGFSDDLRGDKGFLKLNTLNFDSVTFDSCDIFGSNESQYIVFNKCTFKKVHFGYSDFKNVRFKNCSFDNCAFGMSTFSYCTFDAECSFKANSIGTGIRFYNTEINSQKFISGAHLNSTDSEYIKKRKIDVVNERYLECRSLAKLARRILMSVSKSDDDDVYYNALKTFYLRKMKEKKAKQKNGENKNKFFLIENSALGVRDSKASLGKVLKANINILKFKIKRASSSLEEYALLICGSINSWGASLSRCFFVGFLMIILFSLIYSFCFGDGYSISIVKSIDITFLAGYTKHISSSSSLSLQWVAVSNMLMGLVWYAITIPTLVGKIGSSRL